MPNDIELSSTTICSSSIYENILVVEHYDRLITVYDITMAYELFIENGNIFLFKLYVQIDEEGCDSDFVK